jgi:hypothetical protein
MKIVTSNVVACKGSVPFYTNVYGSPKLRTEIKSLLENKSEGH